MTHTERNPCASSHALSLAVWEDNHTAWLQGGFFELRSKEERLQKFVGNGGTLWIVVSRPTDRGRIYTLSFRLSRCTKRTYPKAGKFGRYAVIGDPDRSSFFATADVTLLLLALRFDPYGPISGPSARQISNSLRKVRCLSAADVRLLEEHAAKLDRWSLFISYKQRTEGNIAADVYDVLVDAQADGRE